MSQLLPEAEQMNVIIFYINIMKIIIWRQQVCEKGCWRFNTHSRVGVVFVAFGNQWKVCQDLLFCILVQQKQSK